MKQGRIRRAVAAASATTMAGAALVVGGAGVASAAPVTWEDGGSKFTRTVSDLTPAVGDTITVSTKFERTNAIDEYLYYIEDHHDSCLTFVEGSARRNDTDDISQYVRQDSPSAVIIDRKSPGWRVSNLPGTRQTQTVSLDYTVGDDCARETPLNTGMNYSGTLGPGNYATRGPFVTVAKNVSNTSLLPVSGAMVGEPTILTATITGAAVGDPVEFYSGSTKLGEGLVGANGQATYEWTPTVRGTVALQARFPESDRAVASVSAVQNVNVAQANVSSTTTVAPVSDAQVGSGSLLTATVAPAGAGGTVTFSNGTEALATVAVAASGQATYVWTPQNPGEHTINASFSGREGVNPSHGAQTITVADRPAEAIDSTTELDELSPIDIGATVSLVARVAPADAGGTVTFKDGDLVIGTAAVNSEGVAQIQWTPSAAGQRTVTAEYSGSGLVQGSGDQISVLVNAAEVPGPDPSDPASGSLGSLTGSGDTGNASGSLGSLSNLGS